MQKIRIIEGIMLMAVPIATLTVLISGLTTVSHGEKLEIGDHLRALSIVMLGISIVLLTIFLISGIQLLRTLKKYS